MEMKVHSEYIGSGIECKICKETTRLGPITDWQVDFNNFYDRAMHFCPEHKKCSARCHNCGAEAKTNELDGWFYDYLFWRNDERFYEKQADLCPRCRGDALPPAQCERCFVHGHWKKDKWSTNNGHIDCYHCEMVLCYDCHGLLHYNK